MVATTYARVISTELMIDWDFDDTYTDETAYLVRASGQMRFHPPGTGIWSGSGIVDRCVIELDNSTGRYSPLNSGGALYADIAAGGAYHAPMYLRVSINGGSNYYRIFTGVIKIPRETGSTTKNTATVTIDCRSNEEAILSKRISTTEATFAWRFNNERNESEAIYAMLIDAGIVVGDMDLDDGTFVIPWAWLDKESPVEGCWRAASSSGGRFYCSPDGKFTFDNAWAWLVNSNSTSSQATLTTSDFQRLQPYYNDTELYENVTVTAYPLDIVAQDTIWESDVVYTVPAGKTVVVEAELDNPAYVVDTATYAANTSGGQDISGNVTLTQTNYAQRVKLSFANANATQAALVQTIVITGRSVEGAGEVVQNETSAIAAAVTFWGDREGRDRQLSMNRWIQTQAQIKYLAGFLADRHSLPRLFWKVSGAQGDPERRLGDLITLTDASMSVSSRGAFITAIDWQYQPSGPFTQNYEAIDAADLYPYIDAAIGYFVIGTNTLGAGSATPGRVFY